MPYNYASARLTPDQDSSFCAGTRRTGINTGKDGHRHGHRHSLEMGTGTGLDMDTGTGMGIVTV
jgi:hypothetical protein